MEIENILIPQDLRDQISKIVNKQRRVWKKLEEVQQVFRNPQFQQYAHQLQCEAQIPQPSDFSLDPDSNHKKISLPGTVQQIAPQNYIKVKQSRSRVPSKKILDREGKVIGYCCSYCDKEFQSSQNLGGHVRAAHTQYPVARPVANRK